MDNGKVNYKIFQGDIKVFYQKLLVLNENLLLNYLFNYY
jgi:hypothetical protein